MAVDQYDLHHPPEWQYNQWNWDQIWKGKEYWHSKYVGGVVPNVNDSVRRYTSSNPSSRNEDTYQDYRVVSIDPETKIANLTPVNPVNHKEDSIGELLHAGKGTGRINDSDILYVNPNLTHYPAQVDCRLIAKGSNTSYYRLFKGTDYSAETGTVVSVEFDPDGKAVSDRIPLEIIDKSNPEKLFFKPRACNLNQHLAEGERVTLVAYNDSHGDIGYQTLTVVYGSTVLPANPYVNAVVGIRLDSPYISPTDDKMLMVPENFLNSSLLTTAYVDYRDGTSRAVTIGEEGMYLHGIEDIRGEWSGKSQPLVLKYQLKKDEYSAYLKSGGRHESVIYDVVTIPADEQYSVKLYVCPWFENSAKGYSLRFWLYNLQRDMYQEVTSLVSFGSGGTGSFKPKAYGVEQELVFNLQLNSVDARYPEFLYMQSVKLTLLSEPEKDGTPYLLNYSTNTERNFGEHLQILINRVDGELFLDLSSGLSQYMDWLDKLYAPLEAQYNPSTADSVPLPTMMTLNFSGVELTLTPETAWNQPVPFPFEFPENGSECYIRWQTQDVGGVVQELAMAQIFVYHEL